VGVGGTGSTLSLGRVLIACSEFTLLLLGLPNQKIDKIAKDR